MNVRRTLLIVACFACLAAIIITLVKPRGDVTIDETASPVEAITLQVEKERLPKPDAIDRRTDPRQQEDSAPIPPAALKKLQTTSKPQSSPMRKVTVVGPDGRTIEISLPLERVPSTTGPPTEALTLEKIRKTMPGAYMVREAKEPPAALVSEKPPGE